MKVHERTIKFLQIAVGIASGPGVIFALPFVLPAQSYGQFAGFLAASQLLATLGSAGLEIAAPKEGLSASRTWASLAITHSVVLAALLAFSVIKTPTEAWTGVLSAFALNMSLVGQNKLLFAGETKRFALLGGLRALVVLSAIVLSVLLNLSVVHAWVTGNCVAAMLAWARIRGHAPTATLASPHPSPLAIIGRGLPHFVLNASASLPFIVDRLIARANLPPEAFAQYAVAVTWALPVVYIGNATQNYLIAIGRPNDRSQLFSASASLLAKCFAFMGVAAFAAYWIHPPYFKGLMDFSACWLPIIAWQSLYASVAFPLAARIQTKLDDRRVRLMASWTLMALLALVAAYRVVVPGVLQISAAWQVPACVAFGAMCLLIPRVLVVLPTILRRTNP